MYGWRKCLRSEQILRKKKRAELLLLTICDDANEEVMMQSEASSTRKITVEIRECIRKSTCLRINQFIS